MSLQQQNYSEENLGSFRGCFVEGDSEQRRRERCIRQRALAISIAFQGAVVAAILLLPLFANPERLVFAKGVYIPIPPYRHSSRGERQQTATTRRRTFVPCLTCPVPQLPSHGPSTNTEQPQSVDILGNSNDGSIGQDCANCINITGRQGPLPPPQVQDETPKKRVQITHLDPAMLIHRVEPVYPPLAAQTRHEGRVELRAIVATDGTIQFLQVVSGDPLFIQSAMQAVQQWHYKPTILNGHAVEVETFISVIYNINR